MKNRVAFTTTVPVELILAAGRVPMDLNNTFVTSEKSMEMVEHAEIFGFPRNSCAWIKGLFSVVSTMEEYRDIGLFVAVTEGDCSNARVLTEIIEEQYGLNTYIFNYPFDRSPEKVTRELEKFAAFLGTDISEGEKVRKRLSSLRSKLRELDEMTNREPWRISGLENHLWLVSSSDFDGGDPDLYEERLDRFLSERKSLCGVSRKRARRIAFMGVPPIFDLYTFIEKKGGYVVYNEIQREFAMVGDAGSLTEQYRNYTYPYAAEFRFKKALRELANREVDGIIHYVQAFCHRQLEDIILRKMVKDAGLNIPILTVEGDKPLKSLDGRLKTRIEAFLETV